LDQVQEREGQLFELLVLLLAGVERVHILEEGVEGIKEMELVMKVVSDLD